MNLMELDALIYEVIVDANGEDEQLWAFRQAFEDALSLPADGFVIGEPVAVISFDYDGNQRRGLTARCRREDGSEHVVAAAEVSFPANTKLFRYLAAYRKWMGLDPYPAGGAAPARGTRRYKAKTGDLDLTSPIELIVFSVKKKAARCRLPESGRVVTLRAPRLSKLVPGELAKIVPHKQWSYAGHSYLSGEILSTRLDVATLGLVPLRLEERETWDPKEEYWGEEGEVLDDRAKAIIAWGPRQSFEMEQLLPMDDPDDPDGDPIIRSNDLESAGDYEAACQILMELCESDLRCLDAHAHLGNLIFDHMPGDAMRHYKVGLRIGELSLGSLADGLLPWGWLDNRPFLRCMRGFGLCLWRLEQFEEAERVFDRLLWLNPADNQGVRFNIASVRARRIWEENE
jgi:tetratricopeptide (TPR) repeat protein